MVPGPGGMVMIKAGQQLDEEMQQRLDDQCQSKGAAATPSGGEVVGGPQQPDRDQNPAISRTPTHHPARGTISLSRD
jgi:hypothetical protein